MKLFFLYAFILISVLFSYENKWTSTRFEHWWNDKFNSVLFREPFSFIPYEFKVGYFYYGGNDFWSQLFSNQTLSLDESPFTTINENDFNFVNDIKFRQGIELEVDFLGYNFFRNLQNSIDVICSFGYKLSKPMQKSIIEDWFSNDKTYYYYPTFHNLKFNTTFKMQLSEKYSHYINYSYGLVEAKLFRDVNDNGVIKAEGVTQSIDLGFQIINKLKNKNYNLIYGIELGLNEINIDKIENQINHNIDQINTSDVSIKFTIGIAYGGNRTIGDDGFNYLINSDYIDAIENLNKFKIEYPNHPKIKQANKMIKFSRNQIAYDMLYNGIDSQRENDFKGAIDWYSQALSEAKDSSLIYQIESRQYIIANTLFKNVDGKIQNLSLDDAIDYIDYIESITPKIKPSTKHKKSDLLYQRADIYIENNNYLRAFEIYNENKAIYPDDLYIYQGKINALVSILITKANHTVNEGEYILAYETMKFLNSIYPEINNYITDNINLLKNELEARNYSRINDRLKELVRNGKSHFDVFDENSVIIIGDNYKKVIRSLGEPINFVSRLYNDKQYNMALYEFNNINYRLFFVDDVLFDLEEIK